MGIVTKAFTVYLAYSIRSYWTQFENGFNSLIFKKSIFPKHRKLYFLQLTTYKKTFKQQQQGCCFHSEQQWRVIWKERALWDSLI